MASFRPIGIWRPTRVDGKPAWRRPEPGPFPDHCATRRVITLERKRPRRLCFFGESAAAGYLLAPHVTPAQELEAKLGRDWEVIDFARTNERIATLVETLEAALQLRPDVLVVFTGNNWNLLETPEASPLYPDPAARRRFAQRVREEGLAGPAQQARRVVAQRVERMFGVLGASGVRTLVVVPEVNLADWSTREPVPWLAGGVPDVRRWHALLGRAEGALARGRAGRAREAARALLALDGGIAPTGFEVLARAARQLGRSEEAVVAARAAVDSVHAPLAAQLAAPRARPFDQELLATQAREAGLETVDLRQVFADHFGPSVGRAAFYDYCHLTPEGVDVATAAIARRLGDPVRPTRKPLPSSLEARCAIGAAVHGAHRGARAGEIRPWLERALALDAQETRERLRDLIEARLGRSPAVFMPGQFREAPLSPQQGWRWPHLDAEVLRLVTEITGMETVPAEAAQNRIELWNPLERFLPDVLDHRDDQGRSMLRAPWPRTELALLAHGACAVQLVLRGQGDARLFHGDRCVGRVTLRGGWTRWTVPLEVRPGLSRLTLRWSLPRRQGNEGLANALQELEQGFECPIHPVFGELHGMRVIDHGP